jgi:tRNA(fMet)-specific endonuclease VapC
VTHLLDTDTCIHLLRGREATVARAAEHGPADLAISAITRYELLYGVERCPPAWRKKEGQKVRVLLDALQVLAFTAETAAIAATVRAGLETAGKGIGPMDLLIAATALQHRLILASGNIAEFERVPGLEAIAWT